MTAGLSEFRIDFSDGALFGNDAGEDELPDVLDSYFVDQHAFRSFLSRTTPFQIARSRKGMGKSALLSKLAFNLSSDSTPPILVRTTGAQLMGISPPPVADYLLMQNYWTRVLCARINFEIGKHVGFTFSETDMALVESAEIAGFRERNIVGALIQRVKSSKIPIEIIQREYNNHEELLRRALEKYSDLKVWLLIDDIDSSYVDSHEQQILTSTFFSACRALVRDVSNLHIRASVRTDVWSSFKRNEDLDKAEQYITDILWSAPDLKIILSKKVSSYFQRKGVPEIAAALPDYKLNADRILELAFSRRMKWGRSLVPPFTPIHILSAGRPRWMSQLCRLAGLEAYKQSQAVITKTDINAVMKRYSRLRLNDIYKEHIHQFGGLEKLIETFSSGKLRYSTKELLTTLAVRYINLIGSSNIPELDGAPYRFPLQLAHFLYKIGFVHGRKEHVGHPELADFVRFEERPELLIYAQNPDDGMSWEIHPAYRDALNIRRQNDSSDLDLQQSSRNGRRKHSQNPKR